MRVRAAASSKARGIPSRRSTDGHDMGGGLVVDDEVGPHPPGPLQEQAGGLVGVQPLGRHRHALGRSPQRRHPPHQLAGHAEGLTAGHQHMHVRARRQHRVHQRRHRLQDVFGVVDHHQRRAGVAEMAHHERGRVSARGGARPYRPRHPLGRRIGRGHRGEIDPPRPPGMVLHQFGGGVQGEAGLAAPARAGQRHQPLLSDQAR